jgi:hypothetical protein
VSDRASGETIALSPVTGSYTRSSGSDEWLADQRFDPGSGKLLITCGSGPDPGSGADWQTGWGEEVQIGPAPSIGGFVGGILATIAIPSLLGVCGVATLVVVGILWGTRPARPTG